MVKQRVSRARPASLRTPRVTVSSAAAKSSGAKSSTAKSSGAGKRTLDDVGEQRIYHVTHVNNLAAILTTGGLLADASEAWGRPAVDISSGDTRDIRRSLLVSGDGSPTVASFVPFFLSPNASVWESVRSHATDPRLVLNAHGSDAYDFVILVSTVKKVTEWQAVDEDSRPVAVADGDAAAAPTRFGAIPESSERMLRNLRANPDSEAILDAEYLVGEKFPLELLSLVGVANDKVREVVKGILKSATHRPKVVVYPPWFQPAEETAL